MADDESTDEQTEDETKDQASEEDGSAAKSEERSPEEEASESDEEEGEDDPTFGIKDDEPANDVQMKYLEPMAEKLDEDIPDDMSEKDATEKINEMQENAAGGT